MELFKIQNVSFQFEGHYILKDVSFSIKQGEIVTLFGPTGSGKSTLLKLLKPEMHLPGKKQGAIFFKGRNVDELPLEETASAIGYVMQNPSEQIIMEQVWQELAFGLENLSVPPEEMRQRIGEISSFFGIQKWFHQSTNELSGGQKQLLNLAAVLAMDPEILLLDEPTSQLDPIAAAEFIQMIAKINRELGITILIIEHRLEELLPICDCVLFLENGQLMYDATPQSIGSQLRNHEMMDALPVAAQIYCKLGNEGNSPVTVREGMQFLQTYEPKSVPLRLYDAATEPMIQLKDVYFRYSRKGEDLIANTSFTIQNGEIFSIVGGNGVGKSTLLALLAGIRVPYKGKVLVHSRSVQKSNKKIVLLPQNPQLIFMKSTVKEELLLALSTEKYLLEEKEESIRQMCLQLHLEHLLERSPFDLSGGEQQKVALAKLLLLKPDILLLDEPTKGVDVFSKKRFAQLLKELQQNNVTIVLVTHDIEFAANVSTRCGLFFDKGLNAINDPQQFFTNNRFYTTAARRIARNVFQNAITAEDVIHCCKEQGRGGINNEQSITASYSGS